MKRNTVNLKPFSSLYSCEKDTEIILKKLFVTSKPHSDMLKRLLVINTKDCLNEANENYQKIVDKMSLKDLMEKNYVSLIPKIELNENEEKKGYLILSFEDFTPNKTNPYYRDFVVAIDVLCHNDCLLLENYQLRHLKIMGLIDTILNKEKLTGIGEFEFIGSTPISLNEQLSGFTILFQAIHGNDDNLPPEEE